MATKYRIPTPDQVRQGVNAFDELADTIANPPTDRPLQGAIGQAGRRYCDFVGARPTEAFGLSAPISATTALLCKPYWDGEGYDPPEPGDLPFSGGQCVGVSYVVNIVDMTVDGPFGPPRNVSGTGPVIGPIRVVTDNTAAAGVEFASGPVFTLSGAAARIREPNILGIARQDGLPDNCGDPDADFEPGENPPPTPTFPPGQEPGFDPDGQPFFFVPPIDSPIGGDPIDVPEQPDPDPGSPGDDTPTDPGEAGDSEDTDAGGEASGCAPEGSELTGVFVEIIEFPENAARFQNNQRQPFRGAGYIAMGWPDLLGVDMSGGVINLEQFFHAQQRGITCWRVTANTGFELRCTPYYRELNPEEEEE